MSLVRKLRECILGLPLGNTKERTQVKENGGVSFRRNSNFTTIHFLAVILKAGHYFLNLLSCHTAVSPS